MAGPVGPVGFGASRDPAAAARVRALVREVLLEEGSTGVDDLTILVTELTCTEPGCPPTETVIALMHPGAPVKHTLHHPIAEIGREHVRAVVRGSQGV